MRYPEEIPKAYRRKGTRQKRTKEGRRHEEKTAGGRKLCPPKSHYYYSKSGGQTRLKGWHRSRFGGGKTGFRNGNNTNYQLETWQFREIILILRRQNGDKARTSRFLGRSSRPTHHRDAKEGSRLSGHAHGLIDYNHPLLPFDKDLANRVASITIGADSAAPCPSDREINQNKFIHRINFYENYNIAIFQGIIQPLETFRSHATRVDSCPHRAGVGTK